MRRFLQINSVLALLVLIVPSTMFLAGRMELDTVKSLMLLATVAWFVTATPWMWQEIRKQEPDKDEVVVP